MEGVDTTTALVVMYWLALSLVGIGILVRMAYQRKTSIPKPDMPAWNAGWTEFLVFLVMVYVISILAVGTVASITMEWEDTELQVWETPLIALTFQCILLVGAVAGFHPKFHFMNFSLSPARSAVPRSMLIGLYWFLASVPIVFAATIIWIPFLTFLNELGFPVSIERQSIVDEFASMDSIGAMIALVIAAVVLAPLSEEILFRGIIYRFLKGKMAQNGAVLVSAAMFAFLHLNLLSVVPLFVLGVLLAKSYESEQNILVPIFFHGFYNANSIFLIIMMPEMPESL
ncbi:MAG: CPBP family intramembrane glutamic endopeptidase [Verrucomicrobiota bacterium]